MKTLIISHERSLNKCEGLVTALGKNCSIVTDFGPAPDHKHFIDLPQEVFICKGFDILDITKRFHHVDRIYTISENLLPIQAQLESFYGIKNISAFAAEVLSNKQKFDDFCRQIGMDTLVPKSITPTFYNQLKTFKNKEMFSKPDIGTGSNVFYPGDDASNPVIEYRRWNNMHHFLDHIKSKNIHNEFFDYNRQGIHAQRFNFKPCKIMFQEYIWSEEPSISPYGYVKDGKVNIAFYVKNSKIKYGDKLDHNSNPIESHSKSKKSDIVRERAVWIVTADEVPVDFPGLCQFFLQTIVDKLAIKDMFFAGPDFHFSNGRKVAIDFNPRPGQFVNILDRMNDGKIISNMLQGKEINLQKRLLWGCAVLEPGKIKEVKNLENIAPYLNKQNTEIKTGIRIPAFQNLQDKHFNVNLDITGTNEQELFNNYISVNNNLRANILVE